MTRFFARRSLTSSRLLLVAAALLSGCGDDEPPAVRTAKLERQRTQFAHVITTEPTAVAQANAYALLRKLGRRPDKSTREAVFAEFLERRDEFHDALLEIIADGKRPDLMVHAVEVAAYTGLVLATPSIKALAFDGSEDVQVAAIKAAHELGGWGRSEVKRLLKDADDDAVFAVLEVAAAMPDPPAAEIADLLRHSDYRVRAAAARAVPRLANAVVVESICRLAEGDIYELSRTAAHALGSTAITEKTEKVLSGLLQHSDWMVVNEALRALEKKREPLRDPKAVMTVLASRKADVVVKAAALIALEKTRSTPVDEIKELVPEMHPVCKVLAGRCLVAAGEKTGARWLIECLDTKQSDTVDDEAQECAIQAARGVLVELAGKDLGTGASAWLQWQASVEEWGARKLAHLPPRHW